LQNSVHRASRVLLNCGDPCISYFTKRDLTNENVGPIERLWELKGAKQILRKQSTGGLWRYPNPHAKEVSPLQDYDQLETYRRLGQLVEKYGMNGAHPAIERCAEFLFGKQTGEGDFRGIYGRQYTPNYSAGIMELLIKAGYEGDARIERAFRWLLAIRQEDGGWAIPLRTAKKNFLREANNSALKLTVAVPPDLSRPSSHLVTGVVLRAFAAHNRYRSSDEAQVAAELVTARFFKRDAYVDRGAPEYWGRVAFPFWFTDIVSAMDSISLLGRTPLRNQETEVALTWLLKRQMRSGLFDLKLLKTGDPLLGYWVALAICRVLRRYHYS